MEFFKNLPEQPNVLADLIEIKPSRVISMSLSKIDNCQMMLLAVSKGEEITAEQYPGDTLYYVIEGVMSLQRDGKIYEMTKNQIAVVPKGVEHAIAGKGDFKILQIILMK